MLTRNKTESGVDSMEFENRNKNTCAYDLSNRLTGKGRGFFSLASNSQDAGRSKGTARIISPRSDYGNYLSSVICLKRPQQRHCLNLGTHIQR
jgi:hypothetical protein